RHPPDILIATPESLYLILTSNARRILASVRWLIVDRIHSVAGTKRGSHVALSLERLSALTKVEPQRIGLSATQRPLEEVAKFLGGTRRDVAIVDAGRLKTMEVRVEVPVEDMAQLKSYDDSGQTANSIWPAIYPRLLQVESPPSVAAGIQRVGRAGHSVGEISRGVFIPKFRGDLVETAAVVEGMLEGRIESTTVPRLPLDVLAQQVVAMCAMDEWNVEDLAAVVRRAYPYSELGPRSL